MGSRGDKGEQRTILLRARGSVEGLMPTTTWGIPKDGQSQPTGYTS